MRFGYGADVVIDADVEISIHPKLDSINWEQFLLYNEFKIINIV